MKTNPFEIDDAYGFNPYTKFAGQNQQNPTLRKLVSDRETYRIISIFGYSDLTWFIDTVIQRDIQNIVVYLGTDNARCPHAHLRAYGETGEKLSTITVEQLAKGCSVVTSINSVFGFLEREIKLRREQFESDPSLMNQVWIDVFVDRPEIDISHEWTNYKIRVWYVNRDAHEATHIYFGEQAQRHNAFLQNLGRGFVHPQEQCLEYAFIVTDVFSAYFICTLPVPFWNGSEYLRINEALGVSWNYRLDLSQPIHPIPKQVFLSKERMNVIRHKELTVPAGEISTEPPKNLNIVTEFERCEDLMGYLKYNQESFLERVVYQVCNEFHQSKLYDMSVVMWASQNPHELATWAETGFVRPTESGARNHPYVATLIRKGIPTGNAEHKTLMLLAENVVLRLHEIANKLQIIAEVKQGEQELTKWTKSKVTTEQTA